MNRVLIGAAVGVASAIVLIAGLGAWYGFNNGISTNQTPPGFAAAVDSASTAVVFFWPVPSVVGAMVGGMAGFGSWLVRPRSSDRLEV